MRFMAACGADFDALRTVEFFSSHEALLLDYERSLTRIDSRTGTPYDCSAHFLWIGERTRQLDGAHVDFLSRVRNPIGVKLGPTTTADDALALMDRLNPPDLPGRLTFITRMGAGRVRDALPRPRGEGDRLRAAGHVGVRPDARQHDHLRQRLQDAAAGRRAGRGPRVLRGAPGVGSVPGGMHVELTGDDVTEVLGGSEEIDDAGLALRYETLVDPRLNHQQSLEMAFQVAEMLRDALTVARGAGGPGPAPSSAAVGERCRRPRALTFLGRRLPGSALASDRAEEPPSTSLRWTTKPSPSSAFFAWANCLPTTFGTSTSGGPWDTVIVTVSVRRPGLGVTCAMTEPAGTSSL